MRAGRLIYNTTVKSQLRSLGSVLQQLPWNREQFLLLRLTRPLRIEFGPKKNARTLSSSSQWANKSHQHGCNSLANGLEREKDESSNDEEAAQAPEHPGLPHRQKKETIPSFRDYIAKAPIEEVEEHLRRFALYKPDVQGTERMLKVLIRDRGVAPQPHHYENQLLSNADSWRGSASAVRAILEEMEKEKIGIGVPILRAVLKVLAVHPDFSLLIASLDQMSRQGVEPSVQDTIYIILILTRLNQFELAFSHFQHLLSTSPTPDNLLKSPIPKYLYTTLLYRLCLPPVSNYTATVDLLYLLADHNLPLSNLCIACLLDAATSNLHFELTLYLWRSHVDTHYIIPNDSQCRHALLIAARSHNSELATKAGQILEQRQNVISPRHKLDDPHHAGSGLRIEELELIHEAYVGDLVEKDDHDDYKEHTWSRQQSQNQNQNQKKERNQDQRQDEKHSSKYKYRVSPAAIKRLEQRIAELRCFDGRKDEVRQRWTKEMEKNWTDRQEKMRSRESLQVERRVSDGMLE